MRGPGVEQVAGGEGVFRVRDGRNAGEEGGRGKRFNQQWRCT